VTAIPGENFDRLGILIGWLLDTNITAEIISQGGTARAKAWASGQDEASLYLSILTIAEKFRRPSAEPRH
jgi:predicted nucleic acid-binding protein